MGFYQSQDPNVLGLFGQGVGQSIQQGAQRQKEQDALQSILSKMGQGEDILQTILGANLPLDQKKNLIQNIGQFEERRGKTASNLMDAQRKAEQERIDLEAVNAERARKGLNPLPPGVSPATARSTLQGDTFETESSKAAAKRANESFDADIAAGRKAEKDLATFKTIRERTKPGTFDDIKSTLRFFGYNVPPNADEAVIQNAATNLWQGLRDSVGSIRFKTEFDQFTKTLPDLMLSPTSRIAVLDTMEEASKVAQLRQQAARNVRKNNNGQIPFDYDEQVEVEFQKIGGEQVADSVANKLNDLFDGSVSEEVSNEYQGMPRGKSSFTPEIMTQYKSKGYQFDSQNRIKLPPTVTPEQLNKFKNAGFVEGVDFVVIGR